jgi:hypothetical protein
MKNIGQQKWSNLWGNSGTWGDMCGVHDRTGRTCSAISKHGRPPPAIGGDTEATQGSQLCLSPCIGGFPSNPQDLNHRLETLMNFEPGYAHVMAYVAPSALWPA